MSINCDWSPCSFRSKQRSLLIKHIDDHIGPNAVKDDGQQTKRPSHSEDIIEIIDEIVYVVQKEAVENEALEPKKTDDIVEIVDPLMEVRMTLPQKNQSKTNQLLKQMILKMMF